MKNNQLISFFIIILMFTSYSSMTAGDFFKNQSLRQLIKCSEMIIQEQVTTPDDPDYGAIRNPESIRLCEASGEAVYPLALAHQASRRAVFGVAAIRLGNWVIRQYFETAVRKASSKKSPLRLANNLHALSLAFPHLKIHFQPQTKRLWKRYFMCVGESLIKLMENRTETWSSHQLAKTSAALIGLHKIIPADQFRVGAEKLAFEVIQRIGEDGIPFEFPDSTRSGNHGFDLGCSLESTLISLTLLSIMSEGVDYSPQVQRALENCLYFIRPDGSLDNSWGADSRAWAPYGNVNMYGCQAGFALNAGHDPRFEIAGNRNSYFFSKLLDPQNNKPAANVAFSRTQAIQFLSIVKRAFNLALVYQFKTPVASEKKILPSEIRGWYNYFPSFQVVVVRARNYIATISGNRYQGTVPGNGESTPAFQSGGGAITNLWTEQIGQLQTASPVQYHRWHSICPELTNKPLPLTSRIEYTKDDAYFTNLYDTGGKLSVKSKKNAIAQVKYKGRLCNQQNEPGDVALAINYTFYNSSIRKEIRFSYVAGKTEVRIVEPFVQHKKTKITLVSPNQVKISTPEESWRLKLLAGPAEIQIGEKKSRYCRPVPGICCTPVTLILPKKKKGEKLRLVYSIERIANSDWRFADFVIE